MSINAFQRHGDPVEVGWKIGHTPLWLRGIRLAEGEGGSAPAGTPAEPAAPAASPADVAAMLASLKGTQPPATPAAPAPVVQGFTPDQVQKLMADNSAAKQALEAMQAERDAARQERDGFKGELSGLQREKAVTTAAEGKANAALLLDSSKFQAAIKDLDLTDSAKLGAAVEAFIKDNQAYAVAPAAAPLPHTSGGAPVGGSTEKPKTIAGAVAAAMGA